MIESLYEENFAQGRLERTLNLPVTPLMDEETVSHKNFVIYEIRTQYLWYLISKTVVKWSKNDHSLTLTSLTNIKILVSLRFEPTTFCFQVSKDETQKHFHTKVTLPVFELLARAFPSTKTPFLQPLQNVAKKEYGVDIPDSDESWCWWIISKSCDSHVMVIWWSCDGHVKIINYHVTIWELEFQRNLKV